MSVKSTSCCTACWIGIASGCARAYSWLTGQGGNARLSIENCLNNMNCCNEGNWCSSHETTITAGDNAGGISTGRVTNVDPAVDNEETKKTKKIGRRHLSNSESSEDSVEDRPIENRSMRRTSGQSKLATQPVHSYSRHASSSSDDSKNNVLDDPIKEKKKPQSSIV